MEVIPDANWLALSQASLTPVRAGRLTVHASHDRARFASGRNAIQIEAGEAFGTGHSASTAGCLEALDRLVRRGQDFRRVLDLGCGTGVLAIAAARLLPRARVIASDNDPLATSIARANVRLNRVVARVRVITATGFSHAALRTGQPYDLVLANLMPGLLAALAPGMRHAIRPGGVAILSGILLEQAHQVGATYCAAGFRLIRVRRYGAWSVLVLRRR
jgi:ribosomal protein L11 methyltransferase